MALLSTSNLEKSFGTDVIFHGVSFEVQQNDRIGLVGVNGSGKTTLFKTLTGEYTPDAGNLYQAKNTVLGYMEQHVCRDLDRTAYAEVLTVFTDLLNMEKELNELNNAVTAQPTDALIERQTLLNEQFVQSGGLTFRSRARSALLGLGFTDEQMGQVVGVLSGGQKAKLQLAKMLLSGANLLLLDEPTNHLDIQSVEWLEDFLRGWSGAFLVISHDRYFLDRLCSRIFELENGHLTTYKGSYTAFQEQKELNELSVQRQYDNTQREIKRMEDMVTQFRRWNREKSIRKAESKEKAIAKLESTLVTPEAKQASLSFQFPVAQRSGNDVLQAEGLSLAFEGRTLFHNVEISLHRSERVFLLGPNGCGKTSLFKTLLEQYQPAAGKVRFGANVDIGYYDQLQTGLHMEKRVIDEIWDTYPKMTETEVRSALAIFLFRGDDVFKPVSALSGGERARVLLLRLMLSQANFLLLDEPTNHLDIASSEALENALQNYEGTLFIVSHDRYLINKLADRIYWLTPNGAVPYVGSYDAFLEQRKAQQALAEAQKQAAAPKENAYQQRKAQQAALRKQKARLRHVEDRIEELEQQAETLNTQLSDTAVASDYEKALELTQQLDDVRQESDALMEEWETLSQQTVENA
ncbi:MULTISPECIES: ATP-binding cassette domain-containing protein [Caproicibacterium]|uniref:ABC-F family ATP-binding cassette domain-containing protein n=1 Tax=Caproicibacterium argilliputei TaxID=3030016 RepID=A0AA97DCU8_9FIRM|nr:ABC-F family ATP-binding cassette domain-containing protein [Caproicibacterium argilliputei]WOC33539.1 ABC-F family ATP-binding cassette domain-containing protein [Caproicibacterium argilliputei]